MGILLPAALGLLALAVPIIIFYMLKLRREEITISSSLLWQRALMDRTANAPWQRLRRNLLLLLQLLLLLLLVLSLARPFLLTDQAAPAGNLVVVLDASASMQASVRQGNSRFEQAKQEAAALIDSLSGESRISLIWAGPVPVISAAPTTNKGVLRAALGEFAPSEGTVDMPAALTLAGASARQMGDATVVLVSDGALDESVALPQVPAGVSFRSTGRGDANLAITSLSVRDAPTGPSVFAGVFNGGSAPAGALLTIKVDGELRDSRQISLEAGGEQSVTLEGLPLTTQLVEAALVVEEAAFDLLPVDNTAWALRPRASSSNVLLVSEGNGFLEKGLSLLPDVKLFKTAPAAYVPSPGFGLTVLDAYMPDETTPGNLLIFAPPGSPLVPVSGTLAYPRIGQVQVNDPLLRFVDISRTSIAAAARITPPGWARVLVRSESGDPLILAGETDGRRIVVVAFDLHQSDLPLQVAFPIMLANLVEWLRPASSLDIPALLRPGDPIAIRPQPEADEVVVTTPGDGSREIVLQPSGALSFAGTEKLGVYTVQQRAGGQPLGEPERFVVNLFSRGESNITPRSDIGLRGAQPAQTPSTARRPLEIWPWVLLASLALLSIEWWFYNRAGRLRLPGRRATRDA